MEEKLDTTIILLILIAGSMQTYLLNGEKHSDMSVFLTVPITINVLLVLIYIMNPENATYTKKIGNILFYCLMVSIPYFIFIGYGFQLGMAYKN